MLRDGAVLDVFQKLKIPTTRRRRPKAVFIHDVIDRSARPKTDAERRKELEAQQVFVFDSYVEAAARAYEVIWQRHRPSMRHTTPGLTTLSLLPSTLLQIGLITATNAALVCRAAYLQLHSSPKSERRGPARWAEFSEARARLVKLLLRGRGKGRAGRGVEARNDAAVIDEFVGRAVQQLSLSHHSGEDRSVTAQLVSAALPPVAEGNTGQQLGDSGGGGDGGDDAGAGAEPRPSRVASDPGQVLRRPAAVTRTAKGARAGATPISIRGGGGARTADAYPVSMLPFGSAPAVRMLAQPRSTELAKVKFDDDDDGDDEDEDDDEL